MVRNEDFDNLTIGSDSQWKIHETVGLGGAESVDIDVSGYESDIYRIECYDIRTDVSSSDLCMRVNNSTEASYSYQSIGSGWTTTLDATEFTISSPVRQVSDQTVTGHVEIYPNSREGAANARVQVFGQLSSGYAVEDETLYRGQNYNEASGVSTITLMTAPADSEVFHSAAEVVLLGRDYYQG